MPFPIDEKYILETELALAVTFPPIYKEKMKHENGGEIEIDDDVWMLYPFFDQSDIKRMKRTANHIILETKNAREWSGFPQDGIAIGDNGSGDRLVLLPSDPTSVQLADTIYMWLHETRELQTMAQDINSLTD